MALDYFWFYCKMINKIKIHRVVIEQDNFYQFFERSISAFYNWRNLFRKQVTFATPYFYFCWIIKCCWFKSIYNFCHVLYWEYKILPEYELRPSLNISPSCNNQLNIKTSDWTKKFPVLQHLLFHLENFVISCKI